MEESLVNVEFLKSSNRFIARIQSELGGMREYASNSFEEVLEQVVVMEEAGEAAPDASAIGAEDADPEAERPWMATLFIPGPTLSDHVKRNGPLPSGRAK